MLTHPRNGPTSRRFAFVWILTLSGLLQSCATHIPRAEIRELHEAAKRIEQQAAETFTEANGIDQEAALILRALGSSIEDRADLKSRLEYRLRVIEVLVDYMAVLERLSDEDAAEDDSTLSSGVAPSARRLGTENSNRSEDSSNELSTLATVMSGVSDLILESTRRKALIDVMSEANEGIAQIANTFAKDRKALLEIFNPAGGSGSTARSVILSYRGEANALSEDQSFEGLNKRRAAYRELARWERQAQRVHDGLIGLERALIDLAAGHDEIFRSLSHPESEPDWTSLRRLIDATRNRIRID